MSEKNDDYYTILGVSSDASAEEIKKAYRSLSLKYHPDRNQNNIESTGIFQRIGEAYETLGDIDKRKMYDMGKNNPFMQMGGGGGMPMNMHMGNLDAMFADMLFGGGQSPFGTMRGGGGPGGGASFQVFRNGVPINMSSSAKPSPIVKTITVSLEQVFNGAKIPVEVERWVIEDSNKVFEKITYYVDIFKGIDDNEVILLTEKGNQLNDNVIGDIKIFVKMTNNTEFTRNGMDLILNRNISLKDSLCGFNFEFTYLNGKHYSIHNSSGNITPPEYKKLISHMGLTREGHTGNLIVWFHVQFPKSLNTEQISSLQGIL